MTETIVYHDVSEVTEMGWMSLVLEVTSKGVIVDWAYVEGDGATRFVPHYEYVIVDPDKKFLDEAKRACALLLQGKGERIDDRETQKDNAY